MFIRRNDEKSVANVKMFGGAGEVEMHKILNTPEEMYGKGRVFSHGILNKGCEVGRHTHHGDGEVFYILKGKGVYYNNGEEVILNAGDVAFVDDGETHGLVNPYDEPLEMIALVLYK